MGRLENKVAVITGAASGIGFAAAETFAREGAAVVIADLEEDAAREAATRLTDAGGRSLGVACDAMDDDSLAHLVDTTVEEFGGLHVLCNHVGGSNPKTDLDALRLDLDEFDRTMALNVRSTLVGTRLALPHMIEAGGGSIVNTASVAGLSGDFLQLAYGTAKAAVIRMTQYIATQYGPKHVRCNAVAPGAIMTPALRDNLDTDMIDQIRSHNVLPFIGEPEDIANAMLFLASDESRYVTGQVLTVDGGMSSHSSIAEDRRAMLP